VSLSGAGRGATTVVGADADVIDVGQSGTVRDLDVKSTNTFGLDAAINIFGDDARLKDIGITAGTGGQANAISVVSSTGVHLDRIDATAPDWTMLVTESDVMVTNSTIVSTGESAIGATANFDSTITISHSHIETSSSFGDSTLAPVGSGLYTWRVSHSVLVSETGGSAASRNADPSPDQYYLFHNLMEVDDSFTTNFDSADADAYCAQNARLDGTTVTASDTDCY